MPARCARAAPARLGRRRRPGLRGGRQRHGQRWQAIQPRLRRVGASAAVRRRATGKRSQYGHAHDLAPGRRAGGLRQAILRHCVTSRSGWRGQLDGCAVLIQKRHPGWRHGALARHFEHRNGRPGPGGGGRIDAAQVDPVRPQRQTPRLRQQPAQQGFGPRVIQAQAPAAILAGRRHVGLQTGLLQAEAQRRFRRRAARGLLTRRAGQQCFQLDAQAAQARQFGARALGPGQRRLDQRQPAQRGQRQQGAAGQHALARRQSEPIIPGARAPVRDALAPCRERRRRQGPEREAHERLAGAAPCGARRRRQPPACGSTDTPSLAAALIQSGVPLPAPGHGARRAPSPHPTRRPHSASRPLRRWRRPDAAWPRPTGTRTPIARDRLATAGGPGARDRSRGPGRGTPVAHGHARARAVRRRRVQAAMPATAGRRSTPWRRWRPI